MPQTHLEQDTNKIIVGRVGATYGVKGWLKIHSFTEPRDNILDYIPWFIKKQGMWHLCEVIDASARTNNIVAQLKGCGDPDSAQLYVGADIAITRDHLPQLAENEYYWSDLEGLTVVNTDGIVLGKVEYLFATGSNDVMVINGEKRHLVPFLLDQYVVEVDLQNRRIQVVWDPDF